MLRITKRMATVGPSINTRGEMHGEDTVTALDIPLKAITVGKEEINALVQEPRAHDFLFATRQDGKYIEPMFPKIAPLELREKLENAVVSLTLNPDDVLKLTECTLKGVTIEPTAGGVALLSLKVQCTPKLDSGIARLLEKLNGTVDVEIEVQGFGEQKDLPLNTAGTGEAPEAGTKPARRRRGEPRAH